MTLKLYKIIFLILLVLLFGCSSPEEKAKKYLESGYDLFEQGNYIKAGLQFRNALQIDDSLTKAWYGLSLVEEKQGNLDKVYILLNKVVELDPRHLEAHIKLGKIMLAGKLIDKALKESDITIKLSPDNASVRAFRAAVLLQLSDDKGAINEANIALEKDPENIDALIVLATERLSKGDENTAITYLDKGIAINEKNLVLQLMKIKALDNLKKNEQVIAVFQRLINLYPDDKAFRVALAQYYIANNKMDQAERIYRETIEQNPDDLSVKVDLVKFIFKEKGAEQGIAQLNLYVKAAPEQYQLQFALAELFLVNQQYSEAENVYKSIIEKNKGRPEALSAQNKLAAIILNTSGADMALQLVDEVLETEPTNSESLTLKAIIELQKGNADKAILNLRTVLKNEPDSIKALVLLARAYLKNNAIDLAKNTYQRAIQREPLNQEVMLEYANFLASNKELNSAEDVLQSFLDRDQNAEHVLQAMAQLKLRKGRWEEAQEIVERLKALGSKEAVTEQLLGAVYRGQQQYEQSIAAFKRAHKASPLSLQPIVAVVRSYVRAGKPNEARSFLKSVLDVNPGNLSALVLLAQGYAFDKDYAQAEKLLKLSIKANPDQALGYLELTRQYTSQEKYAKALEVINEGLIKLPSNTSLKLMRARVLEKSGQVDLAVKQYENILSKTPGAKLAANNLASLLADYYQNDKKSLKRALEVTKGFDKSANPYFRDTIGWVYYRLGQADKATHLFEDVIEAVPEMPVFHYHLGMSLLAEGKKIEAKASLEKAVSLSDNNLTGMSDIKEVLKGL